MEKEPTKPKSFEKEAKEFQEAEFKKEVKSVNEMPFLGVTIKTLDKKIDEKLLDTNMTLSKVLEVLESRRQMEPEIPEQEKSEKFLLADTMKTLNEYIGRDILSENMKLHKALQILRQKKEELGDIPSAEEKEN